MAGIPSQLEKGCGQSSCGEPGYSCVEHRGGSHPMCMDALRCSRMCMTILFKTSVWPSIWGWKVVDLVSLVSSIDQRLDQNVLRNLLSQFEMIDPGIPKCTHTRSRKILVVDSVVIFFLQAAIMAIFENLSIPQKHSPCHA